MRISTWHKREGDEVDFKKETPILRPSFGYKHPKLKTHYDIIYITSLFTFHYSKVTSCIRKYQKRYPNADIKVGGVLATLLPSKIEEETKIKPHVGLLKKVEECPPDYSLFPKLPYSITFTTRGCIRKCKYCVVPIIEPKFFTRNWKKDINPKSNRIVFWDNNWLCSPNFDKDVKKLKKLGKTFDFNQGLDCRLFDEEKAEILSQTKLKPLRFAFDGPAQAPYIEKAISNARKYGFNDIRVYVLYNSKSKYDTPAYFYKRINKLNKLKVVVFPMKYKPINSTAPNWVSPRWDSEVLRGLKIVLRFFYGNGLIKKDRTTFLEMFGEKSKEFKHKMIEFNQRDRARQSKKRSDVK
jgi:hypothetical protein